MAGPHLICFADPMCSSAPVIEAIQQRFGDALPIRLMMGGLSPGTTKPCWTKRAGGLPCS